MNVEKPETLSPRAPSLLLPHGRPGLTLISVDRVQHNLDGVALGVILESLAPVVADGVGEDGACLVEGRGRDAAADTGISLQALLGVLVPEVERAVRAGGAESAVYRVEGNVVNGVNVDNTVHCRITMAFE